MDIDRLDIVISAQASKAEKQLNKIVASINNLSSALGRLNTSGLTNLSDGIQRLSASMQGINAIKTTDFTRLTKNIDKLANINVSNLGAAAISMNSVGSALSGLTTASSSAQQIGEMAKNLSKLGNKGIQNAISNMPKLASALNNMMRTLQSAPRVSNNLIRMTEAMGKLASNGNRIGSAARSLNNGFKYYGNYADTATKKTISFASAIGLLYAKFWMLQRAFKGLFSAIGKSMNFSETVNYFEVAMRKIGDDASKNWNEQGYDSAEAYSESFSKRLKELTNKMTGFEIDSDGNALLTNQKNLGLDPDKVMQYQAQYAQMADSIGMTEEAALNTSKALTMLGTDWASLRNISFDQAWEKFASALAGQSRAVRALGIDITQATLQEYAYKYGIEAKVSEMNQATKAQLRLLAILDQSKVAFGDLANTIQSPSNQLRMLQQNFSNLARIIGNLFLPVVAKVLPYINGMVIALQRLFQWIGNLLGIKLTNINTSVGGMSDSIADLGEEDGIDNITGSADDASNALEDANKSAKKLKHTISSYDELEILNTNTDDSSSISKNKDNDTIPVIGGFPILDAAIADALADYEKAWNDAFNRMENKASDFADKISASFKKIWKIAEPTRIAVKKIWNEGLAKFKDFTWTSLKDFWNHFLVPLGKWSLGEGFPKLIDAFNNFLNKIKWNEISSALVNLWDVLEPFSESVGNGLIDFFSDLMDVGADLINAVIPGGLNSIAEAIRKISPETAEKIGYGLGVLFTSITAFKGLSWIGNILGVGSPLAKGLSLLAQHPYAALAAGIGGVVVALDKFGIIDVDWDFIWSKISQIKDILSEFISNVDISGLSNAIGNLWDAFQPFAQGFADGFIGAFDVLVNDIGAPLINGISKALEGFSVILSSIPPEVWKAVGEALGAIVAVKIPLDFASKIFGMGSAFNMLKTVLGKGALATGIGDLTKSLGGLISKIGGAGGLGETSSTVAGGGIKALTTSILGEAGLYAAVVVASSEIAKFIEKLQGGNGILSETGGAINDLAGKLQNTSQITSEQADEIRNMVDECENSKMSAREMADTIMQKFAEMGLSTEQLTGILQSNEYQMGKTEDSVNILAESAKLLGEGFSATKQLIDLSDIDTADAFDGIRDALLELRDTNSDVNGYFSTLDQILSDMKGQPAADAQAALDSIMTAMEDVGISTEGLMEILSKKFPNATKDMKTIASDTGKEIGTNVRKGILSGLRYNVSESKNEPKNIIDGVLGDAKSTASTGGKQIGLNVDSGIVTGINEKSKDVTTATSTLMDLLKSTAANSVQSHSPSVWFKNLAMYCGEGFALGLVPGFKPAFDYFGRFRTIISSSIGDLSGIGYNAIIGLNNGMIKASSLMYSNLYKIAQNIPNIFTNTLQIHSPSRVMENIMELSIEGLIVSAKNMAPKLDSTMESMASVIKSMVPNLEVPGFEIGTQGIASKMKANLGDMVINMQTDTRMLMPKIEPVRSNNSFGDDIRREIMAISSNTFNNNENIGAAVRSAMNGMAVYADDRIIGYLREKDIEARNRGGYGIFEG